MEKDYIIAWKSTSNARMGRGKSLMHQHEAEALALQLNEEHPEFQHIPVHKDTHNVAGLFPTPERNPVFDTATVPSTIPLFPPIEPEPASAADLSADSPLDSDLVAELQSEPSPEPALALADEPDNDPDPAFLDASSERDAA